MGSVNGDILELLAKLVALDHVVAPLTFVNGVLLIFVEMEPDLLHVKLHLTLDPVRQLFIVGQDRPTIRDSRKFVEINLDRRDKPEDRGLGFRLGHLRDLAFGPAGLLAEKLLELLFPLCAILATEVHNELIERSGCEFAERLAEHGIHGQISFFLISLYAEEALWAGMVIARRGPRLSHFSL